MSRGKRDHCLLPLLRPWVPLTGLLTPFSLLSSACYRKISAVFSEESLSCRSGPLPTFPCSGLWSFCSGEMSTFLCNWNSKFSVLTDLACNVLFGQMTKNRGSGGVWCVWGHCSDSALSLSLHLHYDRPLYLKKSYSKTWSYHLPYPAKWPTSTS